MNSKIAFSVAVVLFLAAFSWAQEPQYGDYLELPGAGWPADPAVIEVDGAYYLYPTNLGNSLDCWTSTDLETWNYEGVIWGPAPAGSWNDSGLWAPDVFEHEGRFYLYYTANEKIGLAQADNPLGPFEDVYDHPFIGGGYGGVPFNSIDAHVFRDTDGSLYLYATGYNPITFLRVFPLNDPVTLSGGWEFVFSANPFTWEGFVAEGPWMILHEGVYYLMYSGNGANLPLYAIGYATADNPMGPFTKYQRNPILRNNWDREFFGPGHNSLTVGPDGELWMFYHTKIDGQVDWQRRLRKNKVAFTDDGQLYVDLGLGSPPPLPDDDADDDTGVNDDIDDDDSAPDDDASDDELNDDSAQPDDDLSSEALAKEDDDGGSCCG